MKTYKVKVNGKVYEVELEEVKESDGKIETSRAISSNAVSQGANVIKAPIAGKVLAIKVAVGDVVKKGQTVAVIEAMKLENEIQSSFDGKVEDIKVNSGSQVKNGDVMIVLG